MSSESVEINIEKVVCDYVSRRRFSEYKITTEDVPESYSSVAKLITVKGAIDGTSLEEHLFAKTLTNSRARNDRLNLNIKFQREVLMYNRVLSLYEKLQKALSDENKLTVSKCIEAKNEYIILENLKRQNYIDVSEQKFLDLDHAILIMKDLGKFHGLSFVMKHFFSDIFENITSQLNDIFLPEERRKKLIEDSFNYASTAITDDEIKSKFNTSGKKAMEKAVSKNIEPIDNGVICHGDYNHRNILFLYNKDRKPVSTAIIDFQLSNYGSPVSDILFAVGTSISTDVRDNNYEALLHAYHSSLSDYLSLFDLDVNIYYPREKMNKDLYTYFPTAFAKNLLTLRVICSPKRSVEEMNQIYENPKGTGSIFIYDSVDAENDYGERINGLIKHYICKKFF